VTAGLDLRALAAAALDLGTCSLRLLPVVALSPFLGGPVLPPSARAALALTLGAVARTSLGAGFPDGRPFLAVAASELALGAVLGFVATLPVEAARGAGRLVDTLRGATLGELHVAPIRQRETAVGDLLAQWTVALAAWGGSDRLLLAALLDTYRALPVGAAFDGTLGARGAAAAASELLSAALCLGAPAAAALLCADLALSVASRLAPRAAFLDAAPPLRAALGLAAVAIPAAAIGARLVEMAALSAGIVGRLPGGPR
jgi:type III secretory pathway component EscT